MKTSANLSAEIKRCMLACMNCHIVCLQTIRHCLRIGGERAGAGQILLLLNCSEICQTTENFLISEEGPLMTRVCELCSELCDRAARECAELGDEPQLRACIEACRQCHLSCEELVAGLTVSGAA